MGCSDGWTLLRNSRYNIDLLVNIWLMYIVLRSALSVDHIHIWIKTPAYSDTMIIKRPFSAKNIQNMK